MSFHKIALGPEFRDAEDDALFPRSLRLRAPYIVTRGDGIVAQAVIPVHKRSARHGVAG
jgi:hypothetical protein